MNTDASIIVELCFPHPHCKRLRVECPVEEHVFEQSLAPLSRLHDVPFEVEARMVAEEQARMRKHVIRRLSEQIAEHLMKLCETEDPKMGYSPKEWEAMHAQK